MPARQAWDPAEYARHARFVSDLGAPLLELLAPRADERVLDLGCGDGALTLSLQKLGCRVVGVDASHAQVVASRGLGLDARVMDGEQLDFEGVFDAVLSNAALHWMKNADAVLAGVRRALRPGGRFVAELGGEGCVAAIRGALTEALARRGVDAAAYDPWYFPSAEDYGARLQAAGFTIRSITTFPRPTPLPTDITGWLRTFAQSFLAAVPATEEAALLDEVRETLRPQLCDASGSWNADYVRLRFSAVADLSR